MAECETWVLVALIMTVKLMCKQVAETPLLFQWWEVLHLSSVFYG